IDSSGTLGLATASSNLVVFDPESLRLVSVIHVPNADLGAVVFDPRTRIAYAGAWRIQRFDMNTRTLLGPISASWSTMAMAFSRATPSLLYAGEDFAGWLGYIDLATQTRVDDMEWPHVSDEFVFDIIALAGDRKLYLTRY